MLKKAISLIILILIALCNTIPISSAYSPDERYEKNKLLASLYEADVADISEAVKKGYVSCEEVTRYYLRRIERYNKDYNCFITVCDDAIEKARERDEQLKNGDAAGRLFGVPVAVKDNMMYKGTYTTNGHSFSASKKAKSNASVVESLLKEGAVIIGKTNMSTDAQNARTSLSIVVGETKNAYNTDLSAGGSSGGTATAVSLNFCSAGLGTDTNSSLRYPAALAGCVTLRPTFSLIDTKGILPLNSTRDVPGAITRTVYSQAVMLDVLTDNEYGFADALNEEALSSGVKIGVLKELSYAVKNTYSGGASSKFDISYRTAKYIDDEVSEAFSVAVNALKKAGAEVTEVSFPKLFSLSYKTFESNAKANKTALYNAFKKFMEENSLDAVIFPTYLSAPMKSAAKCNINSAVFINNCRALSPSAGVPELTLPIGQHSSGAGIGLEIATLKNGEQLLLDIGSSLEKELSARAVPEGARDIYARYYEKSLDELLHPVTVTKPLLPVDDEVSTAPSEELTSSEEYSEDKNSLVHGALPYIVVIGSVIILLSIGFIYTKRAPYFTEDKAKHEEKQEEEVTESV
ncbi:MAG: amidase [Clostridia bacterium]|nr:amidase [Clostridia bacterium]